MFDTANRSDMLEAILNNQLSRQHRPKKPRRDSPWSRDLFFAFSFSMFDEEEEEEEELICLGELMAYGSQTNVFRWD